MNTLKDNTKYVFFSKEEIDSQFNQLLVESEGVESYTELEELMRKCFYNKVFFAQKFGSSMGTIKVYRVTTCYDGFDPLKVSSFSYPPNPKRGRANLAGHPVFYCSFNPTISLHEMKDSLSPDNEYFVSVWEMSFSNETLAHPILYNSITGCSDFHMAGLAQHQMDRFLSDVALGPVTDQEKASLRHLLTKLGDLFTLPSENHYNLTSAYAHSLLYEAKKKGYDFRILMYPSVTSGHKGANLAIHPDFVNSNMMVFKGVTKIKVKDASEEGMSVTFSDIGRATGTGEVEWFHPAISSVEIAYHDFELHTDDGLVTRGFDALNMKVCGSEQTVAMLFEEVFEKEKTKLPRQEANIDEFSFELMQYQNEATTTQEFIPGVKVETNEGVRDIAKLVAYIRYTETYQKSSCYL